MGLALAGRFSKSILLPKFAALLLGIVLLGFANRGWAQGGTVIAWGDNRYGQTNVPPGLSNVVAIAAGEWHNLALKADGTLIAWGVNNAGQRDIPSDLNNANVVVIATGGYHNLAVKADGTVRAWGANEYGQSTVPAGLSNVVAVAGGWTHSLALKADGTVIAWGRTNESQATVPFGLNNVVAISAGEYHNLALKADGTVTGWGWNGYGQANVPASLSNNVAAIAASGLHSLALKTDGTVTAWGWNQYGQTTVPADLGDVVAIRGGAEHSLALQSDGTVVGWGANTAWAENDPNCAIVGNHCPRATTGQIDVPGGARNVLAIAAGNFHSVALKAAGTTNGGGTGVNFSLSLGVSPLGGGTLTADPPGPSYASNTPVTLTATANAGFTFSHWEGLNSILNPVVVSVRTNRSITAVFMKLPSYLLATNVNSPGAGMIALSPSFPSNIYPRNAVVTLTAHAQGTNQFSGWLGAGSFSNSVGVIMTRPKSVTALFNNPGKLVIQNPTTGESAVMFMQNTQRLGSIRLNNGKALATRWRLTGAGDFDANGSKDILLWSTNGQVAVWMMQGNLRMATTSLKRIGTQWRVGGVADFNNDGKADVVWQNPGNGKLIAWQANGTTNPTTMVLSNTVALGWRVAAAANFGGGSSPDLLIQHADGRVALWVMNGYARSGSALFVRAGVTAGAGFRIVGATDLDEDGSIDIIFQGADGTLKLWYMTNTTFSSEVTLPQKVPAGWKLRVVK